MKRYDMRTSDIHNWVDAVERPCGGWVKWEDHIKVMEQMAAECAETIDGIARIAEELDVKI